jgi:glycosyltransferase involved in cell wall biosynthesis
MLAPVPSLAGRKLVFVVTEDWFFASHFLPMARAARELGLAVTVVTRVREHKDVIEATGARVVALESERSSLNPAAAGYAAGQLAAILKAERAEIVHCIALRGILVGGFAATLAGIPRRIFALTGLGLLGTRKDFVGRLAGGLLRTTIRTLFTPASHLLVENPDDPGRLGFSAADPRVTIVGGAGVDPEIYAAQEMPDPHPLRVAVVARMLWSKGVDVAVEAVRQARRRGARVELSLYGAPDSSNRRAIPEATLRAWNDEEGIYWRGRTRDVVRVWRDHHLACLPSRGGEGLPRTLLEAAACGRGILTSDVPGCRAFVRDEQEGRLFPPNDAGRLAAILVELANNPDEVRRLGAHARNRVLDGFTERAVMDKVQALYARMLTP